MGDGVFVGWVCEMRGLGSRMGDGWMGAVRDVRLIVYDEEMFRVIERLNEFKMMV